jgi:hypothetical protein
MSDVEYLACEDCKNCLILEDQSEDMRPPFPVCKKGHEIVVIDIMEFRPKHNTCHDFVEGDPEVV